MVSILVRTAIIYTLLALSLRVMGKRQLGELEISELVSTLLFSEIASAVIGNPSTPLTFALLSIILIVALEFLVSDLKNRTPFLKRIFDGTPSILVSRGVIDQKELRRMRISVEELLSSFRLQGIGDINDVYYAVLEQNGQLAVLLKKSKAPASAEDARIKVKETGISHALIVDGRVNPAALTLVRKSEEWLFAECKKRNALPKDVFLFSLNDGGDIALIKKEEKK